MRVIFIHYAIIDKEGFGRTFKLAKEIAKLNNEVVFITTQPFKEFYFPLKVEYRNGVKILSFPDILPDNFRRTGFGFISSLLKAVYVIKHHKFDIVHSDTGHRPSAAVPAIILQLVFRVKHVTEWWDFFGKGGQFDEKSFLKKITFGFFDLIVQKPFLKLSHGIIPLSEFLKKKAEEYKINKKEICLLNGGADVDEINYYPSNDNLKLKHGIPLDSLTFGFIGINSSEINDLIPFLTALKQQKKELKINWFTTGGIISDDIKKQFEIESELKEFGWVNYKTFPEIIACADVFLLLQQDKIMNLARWPNKLGDYMAAGRLILTNPLGEISTISREYPEIFRVVEFDVTSISNEIRNLYHDKHNLLKHGKAARNIAENKVSWNNKAIKLMQFYNYIKKKTDDK